MKSILLFEDNVDILENLSEYFELEGYQVLSTKPHSRELKWL